MANEVYNTIEMDEANIEKFISLYGEGNGNFSFRLIVPAPENASIEWCNENWGSKWDATDNGNGIGLREVLTCKADFKTAWKPPVPVYEKMASDGLNFKIHWEGESLDSDGIGRGEAKDGKFWARVDIDATVNEIYDAWGDYENVGPFLNNQCNESHVDSDDNDCSIDTTCVEVYGTIGYEERIYALPVKKMIETGEGDDDYCGKIFKVPEFYENIYEEEELEIDEFNNYLRCRDTMDGVYLLDKDGNRITAFKDFDHSTPDEDGYIYYPVSENDLIDKGDWRPLTPEATAKWKAKLGL